MTWNEVKVGDVIDGCSITEVEDEFDYEGQIAHKTFTFDLPFGGWSFWVVYPKAFEETAELKTDNNNKQMELFDEH